jgi:ArsR family transcriptional regulator
MQPVKIPRSNDRAHPHTPIPAYALAPPPCISSGRRSRLVLRFVPAPASAGKNIRLMRFDAFGPWQCRQINCAGHAYDLIGDSLNDNEHLDTAFIIAYSIFYEIRIGAIVSDKIQELARVAKALSHPIRVRIVQILRQRSCVCGELVNVLPVAQTTVWQHLRVLKEAGVVKGEIDGPNVCYCLDTDVLDRFSQLVAELQNPKQEG